MYRNELRRTIFYWVGIGLLILALFFFLLGIWLWNDKVGLTALAFFVSAVITGWLNLLN